MGNVKSFFKILKKLLIATIIVLALGTTVFTYWIGSQIGEGVLHQNNAYNVRENSINELSKYGYDIAAFQNKYDINDVEFMAEDGKKVKGIYVKGKTENTAVLIHGNGGDYVSTYPLADLYLQNGWSILAYNQRGCEKTDKDLVTFGYLEQKDTKAAVDYIKSKCNAKKIVVHGQSLGAATAGFYASTEHANTNINYVILDSAMENMTEMFLPVWHKMNEYNIPDDYTIFATNIYLKINYGFTFEDVDIAKAQSSNNLPTLVIQGTKDTVCPVKMGENIYANIVSDKKQYWETDAVHIGSLYQYPEEYQQRIKMLIQEMQ